MLKHGRSKGDRDARERGEVDGRFCLYANDFLQKTRPRVNSAGNFSSASTNKAEKTSVWTRSVSVPDVKVRQFKTQPSTLGRPRSVWHRGN